MKEPLEGNEAVARVAYALSEVIAIYPITPASGMGEFADEWAGARKPNLWGAVPAVVEMQSEAGAAGALHGALTTGALGTTFTASQGLLLMLPDMYKIAGELTPFVMHVAARSVATHALSIFGDHSDVMAARQTGFALLASGSVQEAMDLAAIAHAASLESRLPFLHFFDGFRTSHEIQRIEPVDAATLRELVPESAVRRHRRGALSPEHPTLRGTAQNPDVFFQSRERANPYYLAAPRIVQDAMDRFARLTGRAYRNFDYFGSPQAERVIVLMGSAAGAAEEAVEALCAKGGKVGLLKVRLYRPFSASDLLAALPPTVRAIAVLDRTKEPGALGEPLFLDVMAAVAEAADAQQLPWERPPRVIGGRYGLSSKEFTPAMAAAVFVELSKEEPKRRFTVGIEDDVTRLSLAYDPGFSTEDPRTVRAVFFGLGSDGTVGANKNTIKLIADGADLHAQGYFVYDSKKSGSLTVSHLRFGPAPIRSSYLIRQAGFVACHQENFLDRYDMLRLAAPGAVFLVNTAFPEALWGNLPLEVQRAVLDKGLRLYAIDAYRVAREAGLGRRINTVMQACFFSITGVLPDWEQALAQAIRKSYGKKDKALVEKNLKAVALTQAGLTRPKIPEGQAAGLPRRPPVPEGAPAFVTGTLGPIIGGHGDDLPVSALPVDGVFPTATSQWEKRAIAQEVPVWEPERCIQCNKCAFVCPHAAIRVKAYPAAALPSSDGFKSMEWKGREFPAGTRFTVQLSPEDCTGCTLCAVVCPPKDGQKALRMDPVSEPLVRRESGNFKAFLALPDPDRATLNTAGVKGSQLNPPLFEFSGACAGCGETPYIKLMTQLFGDRLLIANATGCSSIFGGNLPTSPWTVDKSGRGPAWSNSLFEDNAEFGLGFRLSLDQQREHARALLARFAADVGPELAKEILEADQSTEAGVAAQRQRVAVLRSKLEWMDGPQRRDLLALSEALVRRSVWIVGGDGWAYDIGFGGLDHVLRSGANVKVLVLDTEVYSNTGGQASKATPRGAVARFAAGGKARARKDLALYGVTIGDVYVARVAMGASDTQTVQALQEAESYDGPSLVVAYAHCIAHGIEMEQGLSQQKLAVEAGYWPLFRYDPRRAGTGQPPLRLDSGPPKRPFQEYAYNELRYRRLAEQHPEEAKALLAAAEKDLKREWDLLSGLARILNG